MVCWRAAELRGGDRENAIRLLTTLRESPATAAVVRRGAAGAGAVAAGGSTIGTPRSRASEAARRLNPGADFRGARDLAYRAGAVSRRTTRSCGEDLRRARAGAIAVRNEALFNAAICWLRLDQPDEFSSDYRRISNDPAKQSAPGRAAARGRSSAGRAGETDAAATFQKFIRDYPNSPRISEAWVALAELAYHAAQT